MTAIVVADTGPLRYLVQIGEIELLPRLFETIFIPSVVYNELCHPSAPEAVRSWINFKPGWLQVANVSMVQGNEEPALSALDEGEKAAIALGLWLRASLILIDDRRGAAAARQKGFEVTGTLGVLDLSARRGMIEIAEALARLRTTNFRCREELFVALLKQHKRSRRE